MFDGRLIRLIIDFIPSRLPGSWAEGEENPMLVNYHINDILLRPSRHRHQERWDLQHKVPSEAMESSKDIEISLDVLVSFQTCLQKSIQMVSGCNIGCKTLFSEWGKLPLKLTCPASASTCPATLPPKTLLAERCKSGFCSACP